MLASQESGDHLAADRRRRFFPPAVSIGSDELVTINQLVDIVEGIAGIRLNRRFNEDAPRGVRGRNSDNTLIRQKLGWAPSIPLAEGMEKTYRWIYDDMQKRFGKRRRASH